jgi:UDPglucose--hexose-1-phosphate uridylyltransferase
MAKKKKNPSELRFDLISKDWVIIATGRAKRPEAFKLRKRAKIRISKKECPFCNIETQKPPLLIFSQGKKIPYKKGQKIPKNWTTIIIPNKYPALLPQKVLKKEREGKFYQKISGVGFCELVITKNHRKHFPHFELWQIKEVLECYQERYLDLMKKPHVAYVSIFHNHGAEAGASQPHPHSQIITTPLIDVDLLKALSNSKKYFEKTGKCIYCQMNKWEEKVKKRIIFENKDFLVLCPFASKSAFEVIISPKRHSSNFEKISEPEKWTLVEAFKVAMVKLYKALDDPPYNFYLHTAPAKGKHPYYHWHFTILPKTATPAGFELGTRMEICVIEPEKAAEFLRKQ